MEGAEANAVPGLGQIPERLQRREEERQREAERKRREKEGRAVVEEKGTHFTASFGAERVAIEELLGSAEPRSLEDAGNRLQRLQKLLNDSVMFLPPYDVRQAQEAVTGLQAALEGKREVARPRGKFAFKSRKKEVPTSHISSPAAPKAKSPETHSECGLHSLTARELSMEAAEIRGRDVMLRDLRDCTVTLPGSPATLHIRGLRGCKVLCGPVSSSVFVDSCTDCLFTLPCQQLRVHTTSSCRFYLHVTSRAIMEDCRELSFAPFAWNYEGIGGDFEMSGLDRKVNNWAQVDDFNWLARDEPSPNWTLIPEEERVTDWA
ncbi:hypothetical protein GDO86_004269 [Hymenochirus boettgeri]|uniref:Tubulin-specific chaperone C n=1 Tax=Hymenochirus boettgeri TaxID=247094 RepID=A0A8T2KCS5_9PIPI|nr:hypothetical protein GDO86_004269 [Hymenochirus boettgeri]